MHAPIFYVNTKTPGTASLNTILKVIKYEYLNTVIPKQNHVSRTKILVFQRHNKFA